MTVRTIPTELDIRPLPDFAYLLSPGPVQEASMAYARELDRLREARGEAKAAADAVRTAEAEDQAAAVEAARNGKSAPATTAIEQARERAATAANTAQAVAVVARERLAHMLAEVDEHREQMDATAEQAIGEIRDRLLPTVDDLEASVVRLAGLRSLRRELSDPRNVTAGRPVFEPREPRHPGAALRQALDALRDELRADERLGAAA